ncbi:MAG: BMP family ABC transporter substrate-binding protein [Coriobacteriia bacterium]|nr:BMP family ABC transporter substrate-binding protein [Coriobacteriia bacterium]
MSVISKWSKLLALMLALTLIASFAVGCAQPEEPAEDPVAEEPMTDVKAAMVTDIGGLGDDSFNDLSYAGLERAKAELGVTIEALESKEPTDYESNINQLASAGFSPIFAVGFLMTDTVVKVAPQFADVNFGGIDIFFEEPSANVVGLLFKEQEAGYLAGVVAGKLTAMPDVDDRLNDKKIIGFVGGMEIPPVQKFEAGFIAGAKSVLPDVEIKTIYTGTFTDQQKGLEAGKTLIESGADIIFAAAGATGSGTAKACQDNKALFIGVDADQYNTIEGIGDTILTSAIKRVDNAVFLTVKEAVDGVLKGGENRVFGLAEDGVGLAPYHDWETKMPAEVKEAVDKAIADIKAGTVTVPETK